MAEKKLSMSEQLADWQSLTDKVLLDQAVSQGAHVDGVKESDQNDPEVGAKHRAKLEEESAKATKEREELKQKQLKEARAEREKAQKEAEKE